MKKYFYPLLICLLIPFLSPAQNIAGTVWSNSVGGSADSHTQRVQPTKDGGYIVAGYTAANDGDISGNHGLEDALVVKLDASGNVVWQKCLGGSLTDHANAIQQTSDGGYIMAGTTNSVDGDVTGVHGSAGYPDVWIVKMSATGTIEWQKCFGGSGYDEANSLQITSNNNYIFTANTSSTDGDVVGNSGVQSCWIVKIDNTGNILWQSCPKGVNAAAGSSIENTADGGFIVSASADSSLIPGYHGHTDYWVAKLNGDCSIAWQKSLGSSATDIATCVKPVLNNTGYIVTGYTWGTDGDMQGDTSTQFQEPWIVKIDNYGNIKWQKKVWDSALAKLGSISTGVAVATNGDFVVCGTATVFENAAGGWCARLDSATGKVKGIFPGAILLSGDGWPPAFEAIELANDGGFIITGDLTEMVSFIDSTYVSRIYMAKLIQSVLPITLLNFTATPQKNTVLTQWQTAIEENSSYFNVQRSTDAVHFTTVCTVTAAGNSSTQQNYSYTDDVATLLNIYTTFYYRLQEVDKNGNETISKVVNVVFPLQNIAISASPNPVKGLLNVRINNYSGNATLSVFDMAGHRVQQITQYTNSANTITINTTLLAAGTYIISTVVNGVKLEQKFVKQ